MGHGEVHYVFQEEDEFARCGAQKTEGWDLENKAGGDPKAEDGEGQEGREQEKGGGAGMAVHETVIWLRTCLPQSHSMCRAAVPVHMPGPWYVCRALQEHEKQAEAFYQEKEQTRKAKQEKDEAKLQEKRELVEKLKQV